MSLDYKYKTDMKAIIYTNSKQQALGGIMSAMELVIDRSPNNEEVIPLTGNDGLQFKAFTMHAFADDSSNPMLPNLRIMPATRAADCGVSSHLCRQSYRNGLAPSMYLLVQEMGRVDQNPLIDLGDCRF